MLPCGIVIAVVGGVATVYCYSKEQKLIKQLDELIDATKSPLGELTENQELIKLIETLKKKTDQFTAAKWLCGGITASGIAAAIIGGVLQHRQQRIAEEQAILDKLRGENTACMERKMELGCEIRNKIIKLKATVLTTKTLENRINRNYRSLHALNKLKKNPDKQKLQPQTIIDQKTRCKNFIKTNKKRVKKRKKRLKKKHAKLQQTLEEIDSFIREYRSIETIAGYETCVRLFNKQIDSYLFQDKAAICDYLSQQK